MQRKSIQEFYDRFASKEKQNGLNDRHYSIIDWVKKMGVKPGDQILEVGCGVGKVSSELLKLVPRGRLTSVDISPNSIEIAREWLGSDPRVQFLVSDMSDFHTDQRYDVVVMPDVIEHIPFERYTALFTTLRRHLKETGHILIHIPDPEFLAFLLKHHPEEAQIVDQPVHAHILADKIKGTGLRIVFLQSYSLWRLPYDYQVIQLKPAGLAHPFPHLHSRSTLQERIRKRLRNFLR